ncbi:MAG: PepSY domain-containing protein [Pseudomonadota bacterium]|jgi:uncharacterized iron-regulated membrane protein|nr:MAG: PepSY domain-containing protein [Pseudomonadota bacterium]
MPGVPYRTLWRWHFYAGLLVLPFVIVLALSGSVFLFKPQIERWEERAFLGLSAAETAPPSLQVQAALEAFPGAHLHSYRLPGRPGDAALVHLVLADGGMRDVFVSPAGEVLGSLDSQRRIVEVARRIHGTLLVGARGSLVVELVACWAIVMILTGLFLWWPRGRGPAGVVWPRRRRLTRDLHAVTGFWASAFALLLLLTGLPWTEVWGRAFQAVREQAGWVRGAPQWNLGDPPAQVVPTTQGDHDHGHAHEHDHGAMAAQHGAAADLAHFDDIVAKATREQLAFPAIVLAPGAVLFGPPSSDWTATSLVQNRPLGARIVYDARTGAELSRERFADRHVIDRVIGYGQAWHEGALFGVVNQVIGLLTALALVTMSVFAFLMWRRRRPAGELGVPTPPVARARPAWITLAMLVLAALLPLLAISLVVLWLVDLVLPRLSPAAARWLGITRAATAHKSLAGSGPATDLRRQSSESSSG